MSTVRWSSQVAFTLAAIGAAVGLGSIWRFPYLVGTQGGSAFIFVFVLACLVMAVPMLAAEFLIGRQARVNAAQAAGAVATTTGRSRAWNAIGVLGSCATFLILSYYTILAGWVLAYAWKCASGQLAGLTAVELASKWQTFVADPLEVGAWHVAFLTLLGFISARGVVKGLEVANRWRAPLLLGLLVVLLIYALTTGDVVRGLSFAFRPDFSRIDGEVALTAIGQAFYATGVGMAMMIAYGAYAPRESSLLRSALVIVVSIVVVSLLSTLVVFPLVFRFDMDPAQGPELVFNVLPATFALMPGGQVFGSLFFVLLVLAALTPSMAGLEPAVGWLEQRFNVKRPAAVAVTIAGIWLLGMGSLLSFSWLADWHPLRGVARFADYTWFELVDYATSNLLLPLGALLTAVFVGWRLPRAVLDEGLSPSGARSRMAVVWMLRLVCPMAILAVAVAALGR